MRLGVRYSPELNGEERAPDDAKQMKRAGLNAVCVGPAMWGRLEPTQGKYEFDWLDSVVDALREQDIAVFLCVPVNALPPWAFAKYPELAATNAHGISSGYGGPCCYCSPNLESLSEGITRALTGKYGQQRTVAGWRMEGPGAPFECHCALCVEAFRDWLIERYQSEDRLSEAWGLRYRAWSEITLPAGDRQHPSHALDCARFRADAQMSFYDGVRSVVIETTADQDVICDLDTIARAAGVGESAASVAAETDPRRAHWIETSMAAETARPLTERFTLAEAAGAERRADPSAGTLRRWIWQGVANGAARAYCGCWHTPRSGPAMGTHALLNVDGRPTAAYKEVRRTAEELTKVLPKLKGTRVEPKTAMLVQPDAVLAADNPAALPDPGAAQASATWYAAIKRIGHGCDVVAPGQSLKDYKLVIAPWLPFVDDDLAEQLEAYVKGGGRLVLGPGTGARTVHNTLRNVTAPGLLLSIVGASVEETIVTTPDEPMTVNFARGALIAERVEVSGHVEVLDPMTSQTFGEYVEGRFAGKAAITRYEIEKGEVHYVGAHLPADTIHAFLSEIAPDYPMKKIPDGIEVTQRRSNDYRVVFILNHTAKRQTVTLPKACRDLLADEKKVGPEVKLAANGVLILLS